MGWLLNVEYGSRTGSDSSPEREEERRTEQARFLRQLLSEEEVTFAIYQGGEKVGTSRRRANKQDSEVKVTSTLRMRPSSILDQQVMVKVQSETFYDRSGDIRTFRISFQLPVGGKIRFSGRREDGRMRMYYGDPEKGNEMNLDFSASSGVSHSLDPFSGQSFPDPGKQKTIQIIAPLSQQTIPCRIRTDREKHEVLWRGSNHKTLRVTLESRLRSEQLQAMAWITERGQLLRQKISSGVLSKPMRLERTTPLPEEAAD